MSERLSRLAPQDMSAEQAEIYAKFSSGRRADPASAFTLVHPDGGLVGPPNAWLLSPPLGRVLEQLGAAMRFQLQLSDRSREIAILLLAFERKSPFELHAHKPAGRAAGLSDTEIAGLEHRREPDFQSDEEAAVFRATLAILDTRGLDDDHYWAAVATLGERGLFELVMLLGYYDLVATQLSVFAVRPPEV